MNVSIKRQRALSLLLKAVFFLAMSVNLNAQNLWEGSAAIGAYGTLPVRGLYGASNSFPRNTLVKVENLENGRSVEIIIVDRLENGGFLVLLSQEAGSALEVGSSGIIRIRAVLAQADKPSAYALDGDRAYSSDPDQNPASSAGETDGVEAKDMDTILALSKFPSGEITQARPVPNGPAAAEILSPVEEPSVTEVPPVTELPPVKDVPVETVAETPPEGLPEPPEDVPPVKTPLDSSELDRKIPVVEAPEAQPEESPGEAEPEVTQPIDILPPDEPVVKTVRTEPAAEETPKLVPVETVPVEEPVLTYVSGDIPAPQTDEPVENILPSSAVPPLVVRGNGEESADLPGIHDIPRLEAPKDPPLRFLLTQLPEEPAGDKIVEDTGPDVPRVEALAVGTPDGRDDEVPFVSPLLPRVPAGVGGREEGSLADTGEPPLPINGYVFPEAEEEVLFARADLPVEPSADEIIPDDSTPLVVNAFMRPEGESAEVAMAADEPRVYEPGEAPAAVEEPGAEDKIALEVPAYDGEAEILLVPAEERPPVVVEVPEAAEEKAQAEVSEDTIVSAEPAAEPVITTEMPAAKAETLSEEPEKAIPFGVAELVPPPAEPEKPYRTPLAGIASEAPQVRFLEKGSHYIQVGVFSDERGVSTAVDRLETWLPVPVVVLMPEEGGALYKVMVGPLTPDESGVMLFNLRGRGYRDAFLRKVVEVN